MKRTEARKLQWELFPDDYITTICIDLRMSIRGSSDPWRRKDVEATLEMLKAVRDSWEHENDIFDTLILSLVMHTIRITEVYLENRDW